MGPNAITTDQGYPNPILVDRTPEARALINDLTSNKRVWGIPDNLKVPNIYLGKVMARLGEFADRFGEPVGFDLDKISSGEELPEGLLVFRYTDPYKETTHLAVTLLDESCDLELKASYKAGVLIVLRSNNPLIIISQTPNYNRSDGLHLASGTIGNIPEKFIFDGSTAIHVIQCPDITANNVMKAIHPSLDHS